MRYIVSIFVIHWHLLWI